MALTLHLQQAGLFELPHRSTMARWMRAALEGHDGEFTVRFVLEDEGRELNHQYRRKDYATNVLTFDYTREPVVTADMRKPRRWNRRRRKFSRDSASPIRTATASAWSMTEPAPRYSQSF